MWSNPTEQPLNGSNPNRLQAPLARLDAAGLLLALAVGLSCQRERADYSDQRSPLPIVLGPERSPGPGVVRGQPTAAVVVEPTFIRALSRSGDFNAVTDLLLLGGELLVGDQLKSPHLALIDIRSGRVRRLAGKHGMGFSELLDPTCFQLGSEEPPSTWIYDYTQRRLVLLQLDRPDGVAVRESILLHTTAVSCAQWLSGRIIAIDADKRAPALVFLDRNGNALTRIATLREGRGLNRPIAMAIRPDGRRIAVAYRDSGTIQILYPAGAQVLSMQLDQALSNVRASGARTQHESHIVALSATNGFLYALIGDGPLDAQHDAGIRIIGVSWAGQVQRALMVDHPIQQFLVTEDDQVLFAAYRRTPASSPLIGQWRINLGSSAVGLAQTQNHEVRSMIPVN